MRSLLSSRSILGLEQLAGQGTQPACGFALPLLSRLLRHPYGAGIELTVLRSLLSSRSLLELGQLAGQGTQPACGFALPLLSRLFRHPYGAGVELAVLRPLLSSRSLLRLGQLAGQGTQPARGFALSLLSHLFRHPYGAGIELAVLRSLLSSRSLLGLGQLAGQGTQPACGFALSLLSHLFRHPYGAGIELAGLRSLLGDRSTIGLGKLLCQSTQPIWQVCIPNRFELGRCLSFLRARHPLGELGLLRRGRRLDRPVRGHFRWAFELLRDDRFRFYRLFFWQLQRPGGKGRDGFIVQRLQPLWKLRFLGRLDSRLGLRLFLGQVQGPGGKGGDGFTVQIPQPLWHALPLAFLDLGRFLQAGQPIGDLGLLARQLLIKQGKLFARLLTLQPLFGQLQRPGGKAGDGLTVQLPQPIRKLRFLGLLDSRLGLRLFPG